MSATLRLVLFGPPGAGKGTQAQFLQDNLGLHHISSGDLFRRNVRQGTPLGRRAKEFMDQGLLVPDEVVIDIILDAVRSVPQNTGYILDGFPRTRDQAQALKEALTGQHQPLDKVVAINVPDDELVRRLGGRFVCRECQAPYALGESAEGSAAPPCGRCGGKLYQREDDRPAAVQRRIEVYQEETLPVLEFYRREGLLEDISGVGDIGCINQRVLQALGQGEK